MYPGFITLRKGDESFLLYFPTYTDQQVTLPTGTYTTRWFDPKEGKDFFEGKEVSGGKSISVNTPAIALNRDWVLLVERQ